MRGVVVKSVDEGGVRRAMDAYAARLLAAHPEVEEIIVFGSFANGTWAPGSDLDIFVVLSHSETPVRERIPDLLPGTFPVGVDLFPYTREEIAARATSPLIEAVARSRWRYERPSHQAHHQRQAAKRPCKCHGVFPRVCVFCCLAGSPAALSYRYQTLRRTANRRTSRPGNPLID